MSGQPSPPGETSRHFAPFVPPFLTICLRRRRHLLSWRRVTRAPLTFLVFLPVLLPVLIFAWAHFRMALHETAHYLAARLVGLHPVRMDWGSGEGGWQLRLCGATVVWHAQPWDGMTHFQGLSLERPGWRVAFHLLAGIIMDAALFFLIGQVNSRAAATLNEPPLWYWITGPLFLWQGLTILLTLIPMDLQIDGMRSATDGKMLCKAVSGRLTREMRAKRCEYLAAMQRYQPGLRFEDCWMYRPDPTHVRLLHGAVSAMRENRLKEALTDAEKLLTLAPMAPGERAQMLDSMANAAGFSGKRWELERALAWAREARVLLPDARPVQGTLGALLVESGDFEEAVSLLEPLTAPENESEDRVHAFCHLAKVQSQLLQHGKAKRELENAKAVRPDHPLIAELESALGFSAAEP